MKEEEFADEYLAAVIKGENNLITKVLTEALGHEPKKAISETPKYGKQS